MRYQFDAKRDRIIVCSECGESLRAYPVYDRQPCNRQRCIKRRRTVWARILKEVNTA